MESLIELGSMLWNVITNAFSTLTYALTMVMGALGFSQTFPMFLPGVLGSAVAVFIAIYVIRFLLLK